MKPLSIFTEVHTSTGYSGKTNEGTIDAKRILLSPSPGTKFDIKGLKSLTDAHTVVIVEAKIGERFVWPDSIIDVGMFKDVHPFFEEAMGEITEEEPLELYVKHVGMPVTYPLLNLAIFGEETILSPEEVASNKAAAERKVGLLHFTEFRAWLDQASGLGLPNVEHVVAAFLAGDAPPKEEISEAALLKAVEQYADKHGGMEFFEKFLVATFKDPSIVSQGLTTIRQLIREHEESAKAAADVAKRFQDRHSAQQASAARIANQLTAQLVGTATAVATRTGPFPPNAGGGLPMAPKLPAKSAEAGSGWATPRGSKHVSIEKMARDGWYGNHRVKKDDEVVIKKERSGLYSLFINNVHQDFNLPDIPKFRRTR